MADAMTFVNGSSAAFGVVDSRTGAFMSLHGSCIEVCVAGPSANIEVKHELYNDGVSDVCQGVLLVPIPLEWQVTHITIEYEGEVIQTVHAMSSESTKNGERINVNPDLFFHQYSTTPVCSFHLPWAISIGSSLLITTQYMTSITESHHISRLQGHDAESSEMCQLLLPSSILCLSHSAPNNNNKNNVKEDYNALFYNTCSSNPFRFRLKHACSLHVIAQTFSPLCHDSVQLAKVSERDMYKDVYACTNDAHNDISSKDVNVNNNNIHNKTKQSMECVKCEIKEMGDCMFDLHYVVPLNELTCITNVNRHLLLTCLLRPSLEPIRVYLDCGKKCVDNSLVHAMLTQHNTTSNASSAITKNNSATTTCQDNSLLFNQLKNAVLIQVTPHLDSCPVNVEHIFVIDLSRSKQSKIHAQCIAESLRLALHALPPSVYVNVMCTNNITRECKVNTTSAFVFSDGSVPVNSVNFAMLTNLISKMCDGAQSDLTKRARVSNNHENEEEDVILQSLLSLSSARNAQVTCKSNYVRCVTLITNRTFCSLEMNETRFAQVIDHVAHEAEHMIVNTLAITPTCNGETLAGLELMAHVGKGIFREVHINEFYDTNTHTKDDNNDNNCSNVEELSCDALTVALNDMLASCTIPHLTNVRCDITSGSVDYHHFTSKTISTGDKIHALNVNNAMKSSVGETNTLFVCPDMCTLTFAHCQPTYICFFLPEVSSNNSATGNEMNITISGNVGKERVEYTYSCPLHNSTNLSKEHSQQQKEKTCLDTRIVQQCERLIYRHVATTHVKELSEYVETGKYVNQHEYIKAILAFLSHQYSITNSQTTIELSRKKQKNNINDVSDEAIRFGDTFSKRLACKDQLVSMPFLQQKEILHYLLNQWAVKHRARLAHASSEHVSRVPTGALTVAIALECSTSTVKFIEHLVEDIVDSVLSYTPACKEMTDAHRNEEKSTNNIKRLMLLQKRNGSFLPSARFALCVGLPLHIVASSSNAAIMQFCNIHSHSQNVEECWATALALAYMRVHSCKLTILSELFCVYYFTHTAHAQRNVWESWVESAMQVLCFNE